ncbi:LOW QUALITY PROTEIN: serine protease 23-like [Physella acuta]|uniref:LOW QUALITY PROTEIN: serine protease 23-like n=1 Tax=Physella acuta TaxID=109671 RepID=UPI0027DD9553|nr:LOW QUALITY PROTEIN: serine protease 23-like [Physella acuta]
MWTMIKSLNVRCVPGMNMTHLLARLHLSRSATWVVVFIKFFVFGKDDRLRIFPTMMRKFPYSNIVRLSTGCTGTLVTPMHVLTAAHCVHTGTEFLNKLEMLKVELPDSFGVRYYYIEKISIPKRWLHPKKRSRASVIVGLCYSSTQYWGFPNHEYNLWMSVCPARANKGMVDGNLIVTRCDSAVGNSGAAVLSDDPREGKKIIGVLSSTMPVGRTPYYSPVQHHHPPSPGRSCTTSAPK